MQLKKKEAVSGFDESKLSDISEPVAVTIHKMHGQKPRPVQLPLKPGWEVPGHGLTLDEVRCLDQLLEQDFGPGDYMVTITGASGVQTRWNSYFPPEKFDLPVAPVVAMPRPVQAVQPMQSQPVQPGPAGWMSSPGATPIQGQVQAAQHPQFTYHGGDSADVRVARLEAQMERERQEAKHAAEMEGIRQEMRRLSEAPIRRASDDDAVSELRRQNEALQRRIEESERQRQADEKFNQLQRQIEQQNQQFQQFMAMIMTKISERPTGPDPTVMILVESQKANAEAAREAARIAADAAKETARIQADAAKEAARTQLGAREMIDVLTRLAPNADKTADAFGKIMDLQTRVMENALQLQSPPTNPALEMAGRAAEGILGVAQQYIQMKEQSAKEEAHAKLAAAQMQAQAQAMRAQQLSAAAQVAPPGTEPGEGEDDEEDDEAAAMEEELFGPALEHVERLRLGVANGNLGPEQAAQAVLTGIGHFQKGSQVKAFELWRKGNIAEFVGVLVPDALDSFKGQMAQVLFDARNNGARA